MALGILDIGLDLLSLGITAAGAVATAGTSLTVTGLPAVRRALAIPGKIARLFTGLEVTEEESAEDLAAREAMTAAAFSPRAAMEAAEEAADEAAAQAATEAAFSPRGAMEAAEEGAQTAADEAAAQAATEAAFSPRGAMEAAEQGAMDPGVAAGGGWDPSAGLDPAGFDGGGGSGGGGGGGDTGPSGPNGGPGSGNGAY